MFLLFKTIRVASEYIPPSERGAGVPDPTAAVLDVDLENLSELVANTSPYCL